MARDRNRAAPLAGLLAAIALAIPPAWLEAQPPAKDPPDGSPNGANSPLPPRLGTTPFDRATTFSTEDLRRIPRPADPWSLAREVPGVVVDRVNVGGSETALQSLLITAGDPGTGASWTLDGAVTDPAAVGSTLVFPDIDAMAEVVVRTGATDVRVRTPGVQMGLFLRGPEDRGHGGAHVRSSLDALQSDNLPRALADHPFLRNRTDGVLELGVEGGGPVRGRRAWLWGAVSRNALRQDTLTEHQERLTTTSVTGKARLAFFGGTLSLLGLRSEKVHADRDTGFSAAPRRAGRIHTS